MLLIKISASEQRLIQKANTEAELRGIRQLLIDKIAIAETMREFGKGQTVHRPTSLGWAKAFAVVKEVLGPKGVTMPPFPDNSWYARINGVLKREGMDEDSVRALAEYARDHLRSPVSFDFLICQQHRVRSGEFDVVKPPAKDIVPEMPKLPDVDENWDPPSRQ